jgi:hypothetical protein
MVIDKHDADEAARIFSATKERCSQIQVSDEDHQEFFAEIFVLS